MNTVRTFLCLSIAMIASVAIALSNPVTELDGMASGLIAALEKNKSRLNQSSVIHRLVDKHIIPYVDMKTMAASVVGRRHWQGASASQRSQFISEFKTYVISTYSAALSAYDGDKMKFHALRGGYNRNKLTVRSVVLRRNGQQIAINYRVANRGGSWKIYDFSIEGVSMVQSYQAQFLGTLNQVGLAGLINKLRSHNDKR